MFSRTSRVGPDYSAETGPMRATNVYGTFLIDVPLEKRGPVSAGLLRIRARRSQQDSEVKFVHF